jgi:penicillin-binding protein 1A
MGLKKATTKPRRGVAWRLAKWTILLGLLVAAAGAATLAGTFWVYGSDPELPRIGGLKDYKPKETTRILSSDGKVVGELFEERRTFVPLDRIAPIMTQAAIDAEDAGFRSHAGISLWGMARAAWVNLRSGRARQGASTITQQVVKTFVLSPEKTLKRKLQEILLARRLEQALTKDEILTLYLNQIYFGHGRYGVEEAARFFFGKSAFELDTGEAALLAGLPQAPERLSPFKHPEAAKARQIYVLERLVENGHLDAREAQRVADEPIRIVRNPEPHLDVAPEYVEVVKKTLEDRFGPGVHTAGYSVTTTVDVGLQQAARAAVAAGLAALDERHGYRGPIARLKPADAAGKLRALRKATGGAAPRLGETYEAVVVEVSDEHDEMLVDLGGWKGSVPLEVAAPRLNPEKKKPRQRFAANDLVRVRFAPDLRKAKLEGAQGTLALELGPQAAMVVLDPVTREVKAMVGGFDFQAGGFNRALRARRQPGSAFKPFVFAAALDGGQFTPASIVNDAPEVYDLWKPKNYDKGKFRGPVRLREALAHSINTVAIRVLHEVTPARAAQLARDLGIKEELPEELSLALGSGVVTPLEMTNAYATFAAGGKARPPVFIRAVDGTAELPVPEAQVLRPEIAYLVTSLMVSVVNEGTAQAAKKLKREIAGKTGTSNSGRDAWFVGYTPDLVAGVWVGYDDMRALGKGEAGGKAALPIWIDFMKAALKGKPARGFAQPPGVVVARIDRRTGLLAAPDAPEADVLSEVFLDGTAPTEVAPSAGEVDPSTFVLEQLEDDEQRAADSPD